MPAPLPILVWRVNNATHALPQILRMAEAANVTVNAGTPVAITTAGYLAERLQTGPPTARYIAGFTTEAGHNLTVPALPPVGGSGLYYGSVPSQINARNVPLGAPMADGALGIHVANDETEFVGATISTYALATTDLGNQFGISKDATTGNWYLDPLATVAVLIVAFVDPIGTLGGRVAFRVIREMQQLFV
jgi:hypothetical protein